MSRDRLARMLWVAPLLWFLGLIVSGSPELTGQGAAIAAVGAVGCGGIMRTQLQLRFWRGSVTAVEIAVIPLMLTQDPLLAGAAFAAATAVGGPGRTRWYRTAYNATFRGALAATAGLIVQPMLNDAAAAGWTHFVALLAAAAVAHALLIMGSALLVQFAVWVESGASGGIARAMVLAELPVAPLMVVGGATLTEALLVSLPVAAFAAALAALTVITAARATLAQTRVLEERVARAELLEHVIDAVDRERAQLVARIHDGPLQDLIVARMMFDLAGPDDGLAPDQAGEIREALGKAVAALRSALAGSEGALVLSGLGPALEALVEATSNEYGPEVSLLVDVPAAFGTAGTVEADAAAAGLAVVRESLVNAVKHADASTLRLRVSFRDAVLVVEVADNGVGFDPEVILPARRKAGHLGMVLLRERVEHVGGSVSVTSTAGRGTTVRADLPVVDGPHPQRAQGDARRSGTPLG